MPKLESFDFKAVAHEYQAKYEQREQLTRDINALHERQMAFIQCLKRELAYWVDELEYKAIHFDRDGIIFFDSEYKQIDGKYMYVIVPVLKQLGVKMLNKNPQIYDYVKVTPKSLLELIDRKKKEALQSEYA